MSQLRTKAQIVKRLQTERLRLEKNLSYLTRQQMLLPGVVGKSSVKDVLAHLADWEAHMPVWIEAARRGDPVESPEPGLTWKQLDILNQRIHAAHRNQSLEEVLEYFRITHEGFMEMVAAMPEDEMLARGRYAFIGKGAVYDWLTAYANHDLWGKTKVRNWVKAHNKMNKKPRQPVGHSSRLKSASRSTGAKPPRRARPGRGRGS